MTSAVGWEDGDARTRGSDGYRYDDYRVNLRAGQRLEAQMTSDDFDAYLESGTEGSLRQSLASDDDSAGDLNAPSVHRARAGSISCGRTLSGIETGGDYQLIN